MVTSPTRKPKNAARRLEVRSPDSMPHGASASISARMTNTTRASARPEDAELLERASAQPEIVLQRDRHAAMLRERASEKLVRERDPEPQDHRERRDPRDLVHEERRERDVPRDQRHPEHRHQGPSRGYAAVLPASGLRRDVGAEALLVRIVGRGGEAAEQFRQHEGREQRHHGPHRDADRKPGRDGLSDGIEHPPDHHDGGVHRRRTTSSARPRCRSPRRSARPADRGRTAHPRRPARRPRRRGRRGSPPPPAGGGSAKHRARSAPGTR